MCATFARLVPSCCVQRLAYRLLSDPIGACSETKAEYARSLQEHLDPSSSVFQLGSTSHRSRCTTFAECQSARLQTASAGLADSKRKNHDRRRLSNSNDRSSRSHTARSSARLCKEATKEETRSRQGTGLARKEALGNRRLVVPASVACQEPLPIACRGYLPSSGPSRNNLRRSPS